MKKETIEQIKILWAKFTSRKFALTVGAAATAYGNGQDKAAILVIVTYLGVEGLADALQRYAAERTKQIKMVHIDANSDSEVIPGGFSSDDDEPGKTIYPGQ